MRIGHIISKHDADDRKIGRNGRFNGITDDVEHTKFLALNPNFRAFFYVQNTLNGRTDDDD